MNCTFEPWITMDSPMGTIKVVLVDEDCIEDSQVDPDFVEGDNWVHDSQQKDRPRWVPDHTIVLAKGLFKIGGFKVLKTLIHEYSEAIAMSKGMKYNEAHATVANPSERSILEVVK